MVFLLAANWRAAHGWSRVTVLPKWVLDHPAWQRSRTCATPPDSFGCTTSLERSGRPESVNTNERVTGRPVRVGDCRPTQHQGRSHRSGPGMDAGHGARGA